MKGRAIIPLVIGLGVGVLAIKSFVGVLQKAKGSTGQVETVELIRADVDIAPAVAITEDMIESVEVPKKMAPTGAYCDRQKVIGRVTKTAIPAGVPVMESLLSPEGTIPGLASMVREGFRAMALQVDEIVGVAGWLKPGCRVDVNLCMSQGRGTSISKVILQNVEVLAVGQTYQAEGSKAAVTRSVTVLVKPEEASRLHLATTKGRLQLAMRNGADYSEPRPATVTTADLLRTSASGKNDGESQEQSSLLGSFFAKLPKIVKEQTDKKEPKPVPSVTPVASLAAAQPAPQPWVVEVMSGSETYRVQFDSDRADARPVVDRAAARPVSSRMPAKSAAHGSSPAIPAATPAAAGDTASFDEEMQDPDAFDLE